MCKENGEMCGFKMCTPLSFSCLDTVKSWTFLLLYSNFSPFIAFNNFRKTNPKKWLHQEHMLSKMSLPLFLQSNLSFFFLFFSFFSFFYFVIISPSPSPYLSSHPNMIFWLWKEGRKVGRKEGWREERSEGCYKTNYWQETHAHTHNKLA